SDPTTTALVRFGGGHGFGGHFGGRGFGYFGGFGVCPFGFSPRHPFFGCFHPPLFVPPVHPPFFVHRFPRPLFVHRFHRPVFFHPFRRRVFVRRAFFVGAPFYGYYAGCGWLRYRALVTGSPYWWQRYRWCLGW